MEAVKQGEEEDLAYQAVIFEGSIGVGKTTLCEKLRADAGWMVLQEQAPPGMLRLFYRDPTRYGFAMQYSMLLGRNFQEALLAYEPAHSGKKMLAWDRSKLGDLLFALLNHLQGGISTAEFGVYLEQFGVASLAALPSHPFLDKVGRVVFLLDAPERCQERVLLRGNLSEKDIPLPYYLGLEDVHLALLVMLLLSPSCQTPILVWQYGTYDTAADATRLLRQDRVSSIRLDPFGTGIVGLLPPGSLFSDRDALENVSTEALDRCGERGHPIYLSRALFESERVPLPGWFDAPPNFAFYTPPMKRFLSAALARAKSVVLF